eukprot:CAMPEP_0182573344 /NCGR_PEP_ID=MMETSP1324-20130603/19643_1 /TAXON_ID=236786 /ORGANISM="Florenciella sp., Strain RCC1587" /LENGTH=77 /DNA_ID=CAMNT_0024788437 /DNA_START=1 /DNA_END=234 /DNA_ORIENTATION=-
MITAVLQLQSACSQEGYGNGHYPQELAANKAFFAARESHKKSHAASDSLSRLRGSKTNQHNNHKARHIDPATHMRHH